MKVNVKYQLMLKSRYNIHIPKIEKWEISLTEAQGPVIFGEFQLFATTVEGPCFSIAMYLFKIFVTMLDLKKEMVIWSLG